MNAVDNRIFYECISIFIYYFLQPSHFCEVCSETPYPVIRLQRGLDTSNKWRQWVLLTAFTLPERYEIHKAAWWTVWCPERWISRLIESVKLKFREIQHFKMRAVWINCSLKVTCYNQRCQVSDLNSQPVGRTGVTTFQPEGNNGKVVHHIKQYCGCRPERMEKKS